MKKTMLKLCVSAMTVLPLSALAENDVKLFKDWAVGCNNIRSCEAVSLMEASFGQPDQSYSAYLKLTRGGQPDAAAGFSVNSGWQDFPDSLVGKPVKAKAGNQVLVLGDFTADQREQGVHIPADKADSFLAMIRTPNVLTLSIGDETYTASLKGLSAALLYMDEQQQRLNTTTALIRVGDQVMTTPAPVTPEVTVKRAPEKMQVPDGLVKKMRQVAATTLQSACGGELSEVDAADFADALDSEHYVVGVTCWLAAYNSASAVLTVKADTVNSDTPSFSLVKLGVSDSPEGGSHEIPGAHFDRSTGSLTSYSKGRGLGDCGGSSDWVWTGTAFARISEDSMPDCRGVPEFLNVYTATVK